MQGVNLGAKWLKFHDRQGQHRMRINKQWRICFTWKGNDVYDVEIVDYH
ncbi:MAG: type II toxin-antitoxin system RelE/ParE family toxin [Oryzomonas sp.]|nr:type II toxin-antitoxin system RelE/ParE family toxin [Oryzomonas sp.]MDR3581556.1 type II toxin-antitoxin system RelE/ParE family toxin [Oryzomonas sp.]